MNETVERLVLQMRLAQQWFLSPAQGWPHPAAKELIAPVRRLSETDVDKAKAATRARGVSRLTVDRALEIAAAHGYDFGETIDFLDEVQERGEPA